VFAAAASAFVAISFAATAAAAADCAKWQEIGRIAAGAFAEGVPADMPDARNCALDEKDFWCEFDRGEESADGATGFLSAIAAIEECFAGASVYRDSDEEGAYAFISAGEAAFYVEDADGIVAVAAGPVR